MAQHKYADASLWSEGQGRTARLRTFGWINCQRVIPSLRGWHERYGDQGLVVVGIHYPELANERDLGNLTEAVEHLGIPYAITQDNERETWGAYGIRYWPTLVLMDRRGRIRFQHIGEGRYEEIEQAIQLLLDES